MLEGIEDLAIADQPHTAGRTQLLDAVHRGREKHPLRVQTNVEVKIRHPLLVLTAREHRHRLIPRLITGLTLLQRRVDVGDISLEVRRDGVEVGNRAVSLHVVLAQVFSKEAQCHGREEHDELKQMRFPARAVGFVMVNFHEAGGKRGAPLRRGTNHRRQRACSPAPPTTPRMSPRRSRTAATLRARPSAGRSCRRCRKTMKDPQAR